MSGRSLRSLQSHDRMLMRSFVGDASRLMFSNSTRFQGHGAIPVFSKTSSSGLDDVLSQIRAKILLPAYLSKAQQNLIYSDAKIKMLSTEPIIANISGENFRLEHINQLEDIPSTRRALTRAVSLMKDKNDWDQLPLLLQGLKTAKRLRLESSGLLDFTMVVKNAVKAGRLDVIIECARRVDATGLRLFNSKITTPLMYGIQRKSVDSDYDVKQTKQALFWAEMVLDMMEEDRHSSGMVGTAQDPRMDTEFMGVPLHLAAIRASRHLNGEDKDGKVQKYAEKILGTHVRQPLPEIEKSVSLRFAEGKVHVINHWLVRLSPTLHGMKLAQEILGSTSTVAVELKKMAGPLEENARAMVELLGRSEQPPLFGPRLYEKLLGQEKSQT